MDIDLVYLWVDGNDPKWQAKRKAFIGKASETSENCKGRFVNNDELKYSLRSAEKHAPWIRKIFIVTDNQIPEWLDVTNSKINIISHADIMPPESLPCFNSSIIEKFLHKIPQLSEHFLYANDDMFFNNTVFPDTFFAADGLPIVRLERKLFRKTRWFLRIQIFRNPLHNYSLTISNAMELVKKKYGVYFTGMPHHNIDAYLKSDYQRVSEQIFKNEFEAILNNHMRSSDDIQRVLYSYVALAEKRGHLCHPSKKESLHIQIHRKSHYKKLEKYHPALFCLNDSQYAKDSDRVKAKVLLNNHFPEKSEFEK